MKIHTEKPNKKTVQELKQKKRILQLATEKGS